MKTNGRLVLLFLPALVAGGCAGDEDEGAGGTTTTAAAAATSSTAAAPGAGPDIPIPASTDPAKAENAQAAIIQATDLPPGWEEHDPNQGLDLEMTWRDLLNCLGVERPDRPLGIATSPTYLRGLATQARSTVEYLPESTTQAIAAALSGPKFQECATEAFAADAKRSAPEGGVPGPVKVSPLDYPKLGQSTSASRINVAINLDELQVPIFHDLIVVFDGEALIRTTFLNPGGPFPPELQRTLVQKVVERA